MDSVSKLLPDVQKQYHKTAGTKIQLNVQDQPVILELPQQGRDDCVSKLPVAAVTSSHKLSGLQGRTFVTLQFGRSEFQNQLPWAEATVMSRPVPSGGSEKGRIHFFVSFSFYWWLALFGSWPFAPISAPVVTSCSLLWQTLPLPPRHRAHPDHPG